MDHLKNIIKSKKNQHLLFDIDWKVQEKLKKLW